MRLASLVRSLRSADVALGRHVRSRLRVRLVDSARRRSRTGLPPKPYDGSDATVGALPNREGDE